MEDKKLTELDKKYLWHPFTQMADWEKEDIVIIEEGDGIFLKDTNGRKYIDGVSSLWCNIHGHRKKEINDAIKDQLDKISHSTFLGLSNVPAVFLAEKLISIAPKGLTRIFYSDSGSEAVECALKISYQYWQQRKNPNLGKKKFIHLQEAYHGDTLGSVSVGGIDLFHRVYRPLIFETIKVATPYCYRCKFGLDKKSCGLRCLSELEKVLKERREEICAVVLEPLIQGAAGMIDQPRGYITRVRELTKRYDVLLIVDEVATGFGRTGKMFACDHEDVSPDLMTLAKGITGGYLPLSATLASEEIYNAFLGEPHEGRQFFHGHTYTGNQLASRAALANLELFEKEKILESLQPKIEVLRKKLTKFTGLDHAGDIRQVGFMVGIELVEDKKTKKAFPPKERIGHKVILKAREKGVIIRPLGDVIILMPPLSIDYDSLERLLEVVFESIKEVTERVKANLSIDA